MHVSSRVEEPGTEGIYWGGWRTSAKQEQKQDALSGVMSYRSEAIHRGMTWIATDFCNHGLYAATRAGHGTTTARFPCDFFTRRRSDLSTNANSCAR